MNILEDTSSGITQSCAAAIAFGQTLVSIIIPTHNHVRLLRSCIESILNKSSYTNYEIVIVDHQSDCPETLAYLQSLRSKKNIRSLRYHGKFNFSAMNNIAALEADGDFFCFLNNDTEIITSDWLEIMLAQALQADVGAVGPTLLFPNGEVQHTGDFLKKNGTPAHRTWNFDREIKNNPLAQEVFSVTGACLMTSRACYQELDGLDALHLPIAYNDVDYCLRLAAAGYRTIWTPQVFLTHHELATRGKRRTLLDYWKLSRELAYLKRRWKLSSLKSISA